jgi:peroxiredoxin
MLPLTKAFALLLTVLPASAAWLVGQTPTDFTCSDWNGGSWNLYEQRGKVVLINFGATW